MPGSTRQGDSSAGHVVIKNLAVVAGFTFDFGAGILSSAEFLALDHVTVTDSHISYTGSPTTTLGAGIYALGGLKLVHSVVSHNTHENDAVGLGGGIFFSAGGRQLVLVNSRVSHNSAGAGGGIYSESPSVIRNSVIHNNDIDDDLGSGAGIVMKYAKLSIFDSIIKNNEAVAPADNGGGIALEKTGTHLVLVRSVLSGNSAPDNGGGIHVGLGTATIKESTIADNHALSGFGGGINNEARSIVRNSTLFENTAGDGGGAIENYGSGGSLTLTNSTLPDNKADGYGGGIDSYFGSKAELTNATFTKNNSVGGIGGGFHSDGSDFTIENVVSWGNKNSDSPDCDGDITSLGGNVIGKKAGCDTVDKPSDVFKNPDLGPLASNGGPTRTHALKSGSPAIGRGRSGCPGSDQRGAPRNDCDSGAYELVRCKKAIVDVVGTPGNDRLPGGNDNNGILGLDGKDRLAGKGANDGLCGGDGNDRLAGGGGDDVMVGGPGFDKCVGGGGADAFKSCEVTKQ